MGVELTGEQREAVQEAESQKVFALTGGPGTGKTTILRAVISVLEPIGQRVALFDLPTDEAALLRHYTLSDDDIEQTRLRSGAHNRLGFALQLCAFRYPGRTLAPGEVIPINVLRFIAAQLGMQAEDLDGYAIREETRWEYLAELRRIYGYKMFSGRSARDLKVWLEDEAEAAPSNEGLARRFIEECRRRQVILPGPSVLERLCADALVAAERRIETRIAAGLDDAIACSSTACSPRKWTAA